MAPRDKMSLLVQTRDGFNPTLEKMMIALET